MKMRIKQYKMCFFNFNLYLLIRNIFVFITAYSIPT